MYIYELETKNGRTFRVAIENKSQKNRLLRKIYENKKKSYEIFIRKQIITNGIHNIKQFEELADTLV